MEGQEGGHGHVPDQTLELPAVDLTDHGDAMPAILIAIVRVDARRNRRLSPGAPQLRKHRVAVIDP